MKFKFKNILAIAAIALGSATITSCTGDLDVENINPQQVGQFDQKAVFNKIYANLALTGSVGPDGSGDLDDVDEGFSSLTRMLWNAQELPTDEAACCWGDASMTAWNHNQWGDSHDLMRALYYRLYYGVTLSNFFLEEATGSDAETTMQRAEARFLRAFYYSQLMDLYGNVPFLTTVTSENAQQIARADLFNYVQGELLDIIGEGEGSEVLSDTPVEYGRATKAAAYLLLARNYLNGQVYTGTAHWNEAKTYANRAINDGHYSLCQGNNNANWSDYQLLFMGDNNTNGAQKEILLPVIGDGELTQTWGGSLFLIASTTDADSRALYPTGTSEGWGGNRARPQFVQKFFPNDDAPVGTPFELTAAADDDRALFLTSGHTLSMDDESSFKSGYAYIKYLNLHSDGSTVNDPAGAKTDTDVPLLRLGEAYLIVAEADARINGNNCTAEGIAAIKALRSRAHAYANFDTFTLAQIEDEYSREMGYEGIRRQVLIRFNHFGGQNDYKWQWMGGTSTGSPFDAHYNIYAIPSSDLNANRNLVQNPGY